MVAVEEPAGTLRQGRVESARLAWAFVLSLSVHFALYGIYTTGKRYHLWDTMRWPSWLLAPKKLVELMDHKLKPLPPPPAEPALVFVEISPDQATPESPKQAKFYSNKNSVAANSQATKISDMPKIDGTQKQVVRTEDVPRVKPTPLQPTPSKSPVKPAPEVKPAARNLAQEEARPTAGYTPGDLAMVKPDLKPRTDPSKETSTAKAAPMETSPEKASKPRYLDDPQVVEKMKRLYGPKMAQDGGVARVQPTPSLDTKETIFGDYDAELVAAISTRWYELLDQRDYASDGRGRVVVQFNLDYRGKVTELNIEENTVGEVLGYICQKAIQDPAPYKPWPLELRRLQGDTRHIQFTFYYN